MKELLELEKAKAKMNRYARRRTDNNDAITEEGSEYDTNGSAAKNKVSVGVSRADSLLSLNG